MPVSVFSAWYMYNQLGTTFRRLSWGLLYKEIGFQQKEVGGPSNKNGMLNKTGVYTNYEMISNDLKQIISFLLT